MKWFFALLVLANVGMYLWATGHKTTDSSSLRAAVNADGMRLLSELPAARNSRSASSCHRIGPFSDESGSVKAVETLNELSVPYTALTIKKREVRAYRVYLGPFNTSEQIERQRNILRSSGINEHYVKSERAAQDLISLGLFSQQARADEFMRQLIEKDVHAKTRPENRTLGPTYWLELHDVESNQKVLGILRETQWAGDRARLRVFPCT
jgi:hypothetical protein